MLPPDDHVLSGDADEIERKLKRLTSIGKPIDDVEVRIVNEEGEDVAAGEVGEIAARGQRLMKGYWNQESATAETIKGGWLYTGDLGYWERGRLHIPPRTRQRLHQAGRRDDLARRGGAGTQLPPRHRGGCHHRRIGHRLGRACARRGGGAQRTRIDEDDVIEYCRQRLASFKKPESVVVVKRAAAQPHGQRYSSASS